MIEKRGMEKRKNREEGGKKKKKKERAVLRHVAMRTVWEPLAERQSYETMLDIICSVHWWYLENNSKIVGQTDFFLFCSVRMPTKINRKQL